MGQPLLGLGPFPPFGGRVLWALPLRRLFRFRLATRTLMALRRLGLARHRVLLHCARVASAPPPPPPPPLAFHSSDYRARLRFSTATSTPPHFMVDYLVSTCGLSPAAAAKAAPRFAHLSSMDRPDAALAFLRSQGLSQAQARAVVSKVPSLLLSDLDATLHPKFRAVRAVGLTRAEAARLFTQYPQALSFGVHTNLLPRLLFWLDMLGSTRLLMKWLNRTWLLKYSVDLLLRNLATLRAHGVPDGRAAAAARLQPSLIMQTPAKFQALLDRVAASGIRPGSGMYIWAFYALHNISDRAFRAKKAVVMCAAGCTEEEFAAMFRRAPCVVFPSEGLLRRKVEFLRTTAGCSPSYIAKNPVILTLSLEKRMAPRCRAVEALRSKGVDIEKKTNMASILRLPEERFVSKYILKYKDELPELLELYPILRKRELHPIIRKHG